ncbi:MAG: triose-phosphate isomerase [Candidatus Liptonbacteria bacterium]|nr:triose-phosphate isomerase [Candidatus Liptonbacteria bacterium]
MIAYEPIWAIGTGKADRPEESAEMAGFIKTFLASRFQILDSRILYGGSVASANIRSFIQYKEIDGALVGGASLNVKEFKKTIEAVVSVTLAEARVHASK